MGAALSGCGRTQRIGILMDDFRRERVGRVNLFGRNEAAEFGAAVRTCGQEALPVAAPA